MLIFNWYSSTSLRKNFKARTKGDIYHRFYFKNSRDVAKFEDIYLRDFVHSVKP